MRTGSHHQEQNQKDEASYNGYNRQEGLIYQMQDQRRGRTSVGTSKMKGQQKNQKYGSIYPGRRRGQVTRRTERNKKEELKRKKKQEMNFINLPRAKQDVWPKLPGAGPEEWIDHQEKIMNARSNSKGQTKGIKPQEAG